MTQPIAGRAPRVIPLAVIAVALLVGMAAAPAGTENARAAEQRTLGALVSGHAQVPVPVGDRLVVLPHAAYVVKRRPLRALVRNARRARLSARVALRIATRPRRGEGRIVAALSRTLTGPVGRLPRRGQQAMHRHRSWIAPAPGGRLYARVGFDPIILSRALTAEIKQTGARERLAITSRARIAVRIRDARGRKLVRRARAFSTTRRLRLGAPAVVGGGFSNPSVDATHGILIWDSAANQYAGPLWRPSYGARVIHGDIDFKATDKWEAWKCFLCQKPQGEVDIQVGDPTHYPPYYPVILTAVYNENDKNKPRIDCPLHQDAGLSATCRMSRTNYDNCGPPVGLPRASHLSCPRTIDTWFVEAPGICALAADRAPGAVTCSPTPPQSSLRRLP
jgi:hypothetical protein